MIDIQPLPFTAEEQAAMERFGTSMRAVPAGTAVRVPQDVMDAMNRVMAPIDKAVHAELMAIRARERRGWGSLRDVYFG